MLCRFADPRIAESSGVAVATRTPGLLFTFNDSGNKPRFYAVDRAGATVATYDVTDAANVDWEDMAAAPAADGTPTLWFADIGDNDAGRPDIAVYAVPEPRVRPGAHRVPAVAYRLRYPDGPHNAETLLVDPRRHRLFVVTKTWVGGSRVYAAPARLDPATVNPLAEVAVLHWSLTGTGGGPAG